MQRPLGGGHGPHMLPAQVGFQAQAAEGLPTRDSAGSDQQKPDFVFSPQRNRLPLVSNSAWREGGKNHLFV